MSTRISRSTANAVRENLEQPVLTDLSNARKSNSSGAQKKNTAQSRLKESLNAARENYDSTLNPSTSPILVTPSSLVISRTNRPTLASSNQSTHVNESASTASVSSSTASTPTTQSSINSSQSIESSSRGRGPETKTQIVLRMMKAMKDGKI